MSWTRREFLQSLAQAISLPSISILPDDVLAVIASEPKVQLTALDYAVKHWIEALAVINEPENAKFTLFNDLYYQARALSQSYGDSFCQIVMVNGVECDAGSILVPEEIIRAAKPTSEDIRKSIERIKTAEVVISPKQIERVKTQLAIDNSLRNHGSYEDYLISDEEAAKIITQTKNVERQLSVLKTNGVAPEEYVSRIINRLAHMNDAEYTAELEKIDQEFLKRDAAQRQEKEAKEKYQNLSVFADMGSWRKAVWRGERMESYGEFKMLIKPLSGDEFYCKIKRREAEIVQQIPEWGRAK